MVQLNASVSCSSLTAQLGFAYTPSSLTINGGSPNCTFAESLFAGFPFTLFFTETIECGDEVSFADITGGSPLDSYSSLQIINGGTPTIMSTYDSMDGGSL